MLLEQEIYVGQEAIDNLKITSVVTNNSVIELNGENWFLISQNSMYIGEEFPILYKETLRKERLLEIIKGGVQINEIYGACFLLNYFEERDSIEFREELISYLGTQNIKDLDETNKMVLQNIILFSGLDNPLNRREIVGKFQSEIEEDSSFFMIVSAKANEILDELSADYYNQQKNRP
ncbi:hypothetical protein [Flammeovirga yaeyamensis]|uniref:hypothetical protein n=1 Tax=Flammeovirga yaeyamensis TaxID=367791 RepID=UPI00146D028C|nr:hypothetical protein [Flammeovirga yaeyamensis]MBB3696489.1 hypothetical protein [Flammeovirga yaeyamensis]NMF33170.1 hypothetical protein [Flammeovirga yaeyamensis]